MNIFFFRVFFSFLVLSAVLYFSFSFLSFNTAIIFAQETSSPTPQEERARLEAELAEIEKQITEHQKAIHENKSTQKSLSSEISNLDRQAQKINLEIRSINLNLSKLGEEIVETQQTINNTERSINSHKEALGEALQSIYESDKQGIVYILMLNDQLSDFFGSVNNILLVQENLRTALLDIVNLRQQLLEQKQELSLERDDVANLKLAQERQKQNVVAVQSQKKTILTVTKGKESEYQKLLDKSKESAAQIRTRIFQLLGGGEMTFQQAYEYARFAEQATGVRAAFTLAILQHESLLGKNVGRCPYYDTQRQVYNMHPTRDVPIFLELIKSLGIDSQSTAAYVSCPNRDGQYGGAMGPAQFIPSTWKLYSNEISRVTGNSNPSPWNNADAFTATALYLQDSLASGSCQNYSKQIPSESQILLERCAAAQYYSGSRWYTYRFIYGEPVITKAAAFQKDIDTLNAAR